MPRTLRDHKKDKFMDMEKIGMTIDAYESNFHALSRYAMQFVTKRRIGFVYLSRYCTSSYKYCLFT